MPDIDLPECNGSHEDHSRHIFALVIKPMGKRLGEGIKRINLWKRNRRPGSLLTFSSNVVLQGNL
jgi:hypothetical protein